MKQINEFLNMFEKDYKKAVPLYADMILFHSTTTKEIRDRVKNDFVNSDSTIGYSTLINQMHYSFNDAVRLEQLNYKLFLINSDGFPTNEAGLKNHCKNGFQVETIASTGHYPMIEKPTEFNLILERVLGRMRGR